MKLKVIFRNLGGGELDSQVVGPKHSSRHFSAEEVAAQTAIKMIQEAGEMHHGDTIVIEEV